MKEIVRTGAAVLAESGWTRFRGMKVGLVTNATGILPDRTPTADALARAEGVKLRALFGPEHGVRGDAPAGKYVATARDPKTGLPVYSLYGPTRVPTAAMLSGLDVLVFDIQDIGSRSYTYLSTLGCVMEGCARQKVPLVVLDRPNPVGLLRVEGGPVRPGFFSFVSKYPVAYRHGMTLGELGKYINGRGLLPGSLTCDLTVIPCKNLTRAMATWEAFGGLPWVPTSPNVPRAITSQFYAATGIVGELESVSIGIGTQNQFEFFGAPGIDGTALAREMERRSAAANLTGFTFKPAEWTPAKGIFSGQRCGGVRLILTDPANAPLCRPNFELLDALHQLAPGRSLFVGSEATRLFDLDCGTDRIRRAFQRAAGRASSAAEMWSIFNEDAAAFTAARRPYLLYS